MRPSSTSATPTAQETALAKMHAELKHALIGYTQRYIDFILESEAVAADNRRLSEEGGEFSEHQPKPPIVPASGIIVPTGGGKSTILTEVIKKLDSRNLPSLTIVGNHDLGDEHEERSGARHHFGRTSPDSCPPKRAEFVCQKNNIAINIANMNHLPSNTICRNCAHFFAATLQKRDTQAVAAASGKKIPDCEKSSADEIERANEFFEKTNKEKNYRNVKPCHFIPEGLSTSLKAQHLVIQAKSFCEATAYLTERNKNGEPIGKVQRLIIVDEYTELMKLVRIKAEDVLLWINQLPSHKAKLLKDIEFGKDVDKKKAEILIPFFPEIEACFKKLQGNIVNEEPFDKAGIVALHESIRKAALTHTGALKWEKAEEDDNGEHIIPLKIFNGLVESIKNDSCRLEIANKKTPSHIVVYEVLPILRWAIEHGSVVFMDATMPLMMKQLIAALGGRLHIATAPINADITMFTGVAYGKGSPPSAKASAEEKAKFQRYMDTNMRDIKKVGKQLAFPKSIIAQYNHLAYSVQNPEKKDAVVRAKKQFLEEEKYQIGYFGLDHIGHDRMNGHNLAIFGTHSFSTNAIADGYGSDRAALMQVGVYWEPFNGVMDSEEVRKTQGGYPLPTQPQVRAWFLDKAAIPTVQAIGRARAIRSERRLTIQIWGGLQMPDFINALADHGITIGEFRPNDIHRTAKDYQARGTDLNAIYDVIDMLVKLEQPVSRPIVLAALFQKYGKGKDKDVIQECINARRAAGQVPPPSKAHRPSTAEVLIACDAYINVVSITGNEQNNKDHEQNNKNSHLEEVETLLRSVSKKQTIATEPRAAPRVKATLFRKQSAFIEEVRGFIDVLAAQGVTINELKPDDIQVFEEQGDDRG